MNCTERIHELSKWWTYRGKQLHLDAQKASTLNKKLKIQEMHIKYLELQKETYHECLFFGDSDLEQSER